MHETSNVSNALVAGESRYENTAWFARFLTWYRTAIAGVTQEQIDRSGGPSRGTQAPIEKGEAVIVSEETLSKYIRAYTEVTGAKRNLNVSLLRAVFAIFADRGGDWDRRLSLRDTAENWQHEHQLFLGVMIPSGVTVTGHGLELMTVNHQTDSDNRDEFIRQACRIALFQPSVTLLPAQYANNTAILRGLGRWRQVKPRGGRRYIGVRANRAAKTVFDPIADAVDLDQAIARAEALGVHGEETTEMAWIILVANELAARRNRTPIDVIGTLFTDPDGREAFKRLFEALGATPDLDAMARLASRVLGGWRNEYLTATVDVRLQPCDGMPTLRAHADHHSASLADIPEQSLWIYDPVRLPQLPNVIAAQHNSALAVTPERIFLHTPAPAGTVYTWLPIDGDRGVMRDSNDHWIPVHMPSTSLLIPRSDLDAPRYTGAETN